jgi:hypothetical protein
MAASLFDRCARPLAETPITAIMSGGRVAGYRSIPDATRYHSPEPIYSAVWIIREAEEQPRDYGPTHVHDFPELNILAGSPGELVYRIRLGDEERDVESPATVLVPPHVPHSANLIRGSGAFVVVRLMPEQIAASEGLSEPPGPGAA